MGTKHRAGADVVAAVCAGLMLFTGGATPWPGIASAGTPVVRHLDSLNAWDHQHVGAPGGLVAHLPGSGAVHFAWTNHYLIDDGLDELDPIVRYRADHCPAAFA